MIIFTTHHAVSFLKFRMDNLEYFKTQWWVHVNLLEELSNTKNKLAEFNELFDFMLRHDPDLKKAWIIWRRNQINYIAQWNYSHADKRTSEYESDAAL